MLQFQIILYLPAGGRGKSGCEISEICLLGLLIFCEGALRSKGIPSPQVLWNQTPSNHKKSNFKISWYSLISHLWGLYYLFP